MGYRYLLGILVFIAACNLQQKAGNEKKNGSNPQLIANDTVPNFFPVTSYLKGEIYGIKTGGISPIKKTTIKNKMDSVWLKEADFDSSFAAFLSPLIDTSNLKNTFTEKRFLDQTLNAFTFTYDPVNNQKTSFAFTHWDVYVDPETNKVRRIYLTKMIGNDTELLLTWQSGKWCRIVTVKNISGKITIIKEEKISWSYDE